MRSRGAAHRRQPGPGRRRDGARGRRRRVPRLQRERGPAVRADLPAQGRGAERRRPGEGNEVRIGGARVGVVDKITTRRLEDGSSVAVHRPEARARPSKPLPKDSTIIIRPKSALGLKYVEITRGTLGRGLPGRRHDPALGVEARAGRVRRVLQHVRRRRRARRRRRTCAASATRFAGRGASLNDALGVAAPLLRDIQPGRAATSSDPRHATSRRFFAALGDAARDRRAGRRGAGRAVRRTSTPRSPRSPRSRGRSSRTRSPRGRPRSTPRSSRSRSSGRSCATPRACSASCARACARCAPRRPTSPTRSRSARRRCARSPALNRRLASLLRELQTFARTRWCRSASSGLTETRRGAATRRSTTSRRPRLHCNYIDAVVPQRRLAAVRGRRERHLAAVHHHRHAAGPQQRGRPVVGARERPDRSTTTCTPTRTRTRRRRASPGVRGRQRAVRPAARGDRQRARQAGRATTEGDRVMARRRRRPPHAAAARSRSG